MMTLIRNYLRYRNIQVDTGLILGPALWDIFYDEVLGAEMSGGFELVVYADDLSLVAADLGIESLKSKLEVAIRRIEDGRKPVKED